ncbi:MAG: 3'-5' exoribonuclease YhaM family protein [Candidatus Hydrothermia bacterium]
MPKKHFVKDLEQFVGMEIEDVFLVRDILDKSTRDGQEYLELIIVDLSGSQTARIFDNIEDVRVKIEKGKIYKLRLSIYQYYGNQLGIKILDAERVMTYDIRDFIPSSQRNPQEMFNELKKFINSVKNPYLNELLKRIFLSEKTEKDIEFREKFLIAPAAKQNHHDYVGGLLEHTLNVVKAADLLSEMYNYIDRDLLISGALLHDIGKVYEYEFTPDIDFSDIGRLLGHIAIGFEIVNTKIKEMEFMRQFPEELKMKILHMILSHHGELVYGSPVRPSFLEAQILHFLDDLDAKAYMYKKAYDLRSETNKKWSEYLNALKRSVYLGEPEEME